MATTQGQTQVMVIGGGPAGLSLAVMCRSTGLNVCVIEASPQRISPGEALPSWIRDYFEALGVEHLMSDDRVSYEAMDYCWGGVTRRALRDEDRRGFRPNGIQLPRQFLDGALLQRALDLGVTVLQPCTVRGLFTRGNRLAGVATSQGDYTSDYIVDAAGSRHWLARKLRLQMEFHSPELFGYYGWAEGHCPIRFDRPLVASTDNGWEFTSRVHKDLYQFVRMSFSAESLPRDWMPQEYLDRKMRAVSPHQVAAGERRADGRLRGADLTWRRVQRPAGPGFFVCGDAHSRTDPIGQQGVSKSIAGAVRLAMTLRHIYDGSVSEDEAVEEYCQWATASYLRDLEEVRKSYQLHPSAPAWLWDGSCVRMAHLEPQVNRKCILERSPTGRPAPSKPPS